MSKKIDLSERFSNFNNKGVNNLLNNQDHSKIQYLSISQIKVNINNFFSIEDIDSLKISILDVGLRFPLDIIKTSDGLYKLIGGERRFTALSQLIKDGYSQFDLIPCIISSISDIKLNLKDTSKEMYAIITTNYENRKNSDYEEMLCVCHLYEIYTEMKKNGTTLKGRQRDYVAKELSLSSSQIHRYKYIHTHLADEFQKLFKKKAMGMTIAYSISQLTKDEQLSFYKSCNNLEKISSNDIEDFSISEKLVVSSKNKVQPSLDLYALDYTPTSLNANLIVSQFNASFNTLLEKEKIKDVDNFRNLQKQISSIQKTLDKIDKILIKESKV